MKKIMTVIICAAMIMSLAACGGSAEASKSIGSSSEAPAASSSAEAASPEEEIPGVYDLYACAVDEYVLDASLIYEDGATLTVREDNEGGQIDINGEAGGFATWELDGTTLSFYEEGDPEPLVTEYIDGVILIESDGVSMYFAKEGADVSWIDVMTDEEFEAAIAANAESSSAAE